MKKGTTATIVFALAVSQIMFSACKKAEMPRPQASQQAPQQAQEPAPKTEVLQKSFEESKKAVAARVNGQAITMFSLYREMNAITPRYLAPGQQKTPELFQRVYAAALQRLIFKELAVQEARRLGMKAGKDAIDEEIKKIKANAGSEDAYKKYLETNGLTESALRKMLEQLYLFEMFLSHEIDAKIAITEDDLRARYDKDKARLVTSDAAHRQMSFEEVKDLLEQRIRAEEREKKRQAWETELKKKARIEISEPGKKQG